MRDLRPRARGWAKGLAWCDGLPDGVVQHVHGLEDRDIAPPLRRCRAGDVEAEHDEDGGDEETGIETGGGDIILLHELVSLFYEMKMEGERTYCIHQPL
jgi:hypothetical protein